MSASDDPRAVERVGAVLDDKWTLERLLGMGGMAAVYSARHRNGARAAVKMLHPELARHPQVRERFLREGYAANKVEHRGTVQVLDDHVVKDGPDEGTAYLVMELLEGEALDARLPPISEREVLEIFSGVLDVLEAAHARGVVHRDLKPDNLFLAKDPDGGPPRIKVLDFGLARIAEVASVTVEGLALGTPSFMSPEQAAGRTSEIDGRTDIFALAATGFYLLTGQYLHDGDSILQIVVKMAKDAAPPIRSVDPKISEPVAKIIDRALQFAREDRYPTAGAMRADVDAALHELTLQDTRATVQVAVPDEAKIAAALESSMPPPRRRGFPFVTAFVALAVGGVGFYFYPQLRAEWEHRGGPALSAAIVDAGASMLAEPPDATAEADASASAIAVVDASIDDATSDAAADEDDDDDDDAGPDAGALAKPLMHPAHTLPKKPKPHGPKPRKRH